jgi:seryl-tRNA synthetase
MHNIKDIRNNFDNFKNIIKLRNVSINLDEIINLDKSNRNLIQEKETLEREKKEISKKMINHYS